MTIMRPNFSAAIGATVSRRPSPLALLSRKWWCQSSGSGIVSELCLSLFAESVVVAIFLRLDGWWMDGREAEDITSGP